MNIKRIVTAGIAGSITFFIYGGLVFGKLLANDYRPYTSVYRSMTEMQQHMLVGMLCSIAGIIVLAVMYAKGYEGGSGAAEGARFGLLIGIFAACTHIADNYVVLQIGGTLAAKMALASLGEWTLVGLVIGLVYRPREIKGGIV
ncbi:MAG: hypothetical protein ACJ71N_03010 [Terriglobales bacterium]|jgi:hypothetical protein